MKSVAISCQDLYVLLKIIFYVCVYITLHIYVNRKFYRFVLYEKLCHIVGKPLNTWAYGRHKELA